jgi:hypothetical protein
MPSLGDRTPAEDVSGSAHRHSNGTYLHQVSHVAWIRARSRARLTRFDADTSDSRQVRTSQGPDVNGDWHPLLLHSPMRPCCVHRRGQT